MSYKINNKKGVSQVIGVVLTIVIALAAIVLVWTSTQTFLLSPNIECETLSLTPPIKLNKACHLNENEILLRFERNLEEIDIESMKIHLIGQETAIYQITEKDCSDIKRENGEYNRPCTIPNIGSTLSYIFLLDTEAGESSDQFNDVLLDIDYQLSTGQVDTCITDQRRLELSC